MKPIWHGDLRREKDAPVSYMALNPAPAKFWTENIVASKITFSAAGERQEEVTLTAAEWWALEPLEIINNDVSKAGWLTQKPGAVSVNTGNSATTVANISDTGPDGLTLVGVSASGFDAMG